MTDEPGRQAAPGAPVITRGELEAVIRRAAELLLDDRAEEPLDERELVAIAEEVGIPAPYARQALYERAGAPDSALRDRLWGPARAVVFRRMEGRASAVLQRLEDHLVGEQYLRLVRGTPGRRMFAPADDAITSALRVLTRPSRRYPLTRLRRLDLAVRALDENSAHVALTADLGDRRRGAIVRSGFGGALSALVGAGVAVPITAAAAALGPEAAVAAGALGGTTLFMGGLATSIAITGRSFRRRLARIRFEVDTLLDRLEHGPSLSAPPAPWRRRIARQAIGDRR